MAKVRAVTAHSDLVVSLSLLFGTMALYVAFANYNLSALVNDTYFTSFPAWALGTNGTLDMDGTVAKTGWFLVTPDGDLRSDRFPGAILVAAPFYALLGTDVFSIAPGSISAGVCAAVGVLFVYRALLRLTSLRVALASACIFAFGTSMWTVAGDASWTHSVTITGLAIASWAMSRGSYFGSGFGFAFAILGRPHTAVAAAIMGTWESISRASFRPMIKVGAASILGFVGLLIYNRINAGVWTILPGSYSERIAGATTTGPGGQASADTWLEDVLASFFSPLRGVFVYSPFLLLLLPGIPRAWRAAPAWVRASAVSGIVYLVIQLAGNVWNGGTGFFGYRITIETVMLSVPLLTLAWVEWTSQGVWRRRAMAVLTGVSLWWFALAAGGFDLGWEQYTRWQDWDVPRLVANTSPGGPLVALVFVALLAWLVLPLDDGKRSEIVQPGFSLERDTAVGRRQEASTSTTKQPAVAASGARKAGGSKGSTGGKSTASGKSSAKNKKR